jgi:hypothetical protein
VTPPFPTSVEQLAPWQVFADQLIERGDRLGPYLSYELSLGAQPTLEQRIGFGKRALRVCRVPRPFSATWMLGHVKALFLTPDRSRAMPLLDGGSLPALRDLFDTPALVNLEQLSFSAQGDSIGRRWREAMLRLPKSCRCFELYASRFTADDAARVIDGIPDQVEVLRVLPWFGTDPSRLVSDRFEWIDLRPMVLTQATAEALASALAATKRVKVRLGTLNRCTLNERAVVGDLDDAALVGEGSASVVLLERQRLEALQARDGVVPVRAQVERSLEESFRLGRAFSSLDDTSAWIGDAVISWSEGAWSIRGVGVSSVALDGAPLTPKPVPLADGASLVIGGRPWRFAERCR